jgi:acyl-CoA thioester hydrolase
MSFAFPIRVYWEDTDAGGIVFYANYLKYFERARTEWLRSLGIGQEQLRRSAGGLFVVGETNVRYLQPARLDDELLVTARIESAGRASIALAQEAFRAHDRVLLCEGAIRIGWVEAATLKPARMPANLLEALKQ